MIEEQYTYNEYKAGLELFYSNPITYANVADPSDPLYRTKYFHCMPPLEAYKLVPPHKDKGGNT